MLGSNRTKLADLKNNFVYVKKRGEPGLLKGILHQVRGYGKQDHAKRDWSVCDYETKATQYWEENNVKEIIDNLIILK